MIILINNNEHVTHTYKHNLWEGEEERERNGKESLLRRRSREDNTIEIIRNVMNAFQEWVGCICIYVCSCVWVDLILKFNTCNNNLKIKEPKQKTKTYIPYFSLSSFCRTTAFNHAVSRELNWCSAVQCSAVRCNPSSINSIIRLSSRHDMTCASYIMISHVFVCLFPPTHPPTH